MANLKEKYNNELRPALKEELGIDNIMAVPKLTKVVINMGVGAVSYTHLTLPTIVLV